MPFNLKGDALLAALNHQDFEREFGKYQVKDWEQTVFSNKEFLNVKLSELGKLVLAIKHSSKKFPPLAEKPFSLLPPPEKINAAQSSSATTAKVKAVIAEEYKRIVDLCGGFGIDAYYMQDGKLLFHIEPNETVHATAKYNFRKHENVTCIHSSAELFWKEHDYREGDLIYADPSRVDEKNNRVSLLENYLPDVSDLPKLCQEKHCGLLLKLSPMLDIDALKLQWAKYPFDLHLVSVGNELKDLLLHFTTTNYQKTFVHHIMGESKDVFEIVGGVFASFNCSQPKFVYDPNPAFKKLRSHGFLAKKFELSLENDFLVSAEFKKDFPGKVFEITESLELDKNTKKRLQKAKLSVISRHTHLNPKVIEQRFKLIPDSSKFLLCYEENAKAKVYLATRKY